MTALRDFCAVVAEMWRAWPDLLIERIDRMTDGLNEWNEGHR